MAGEVERQCPMKEDDMRNNSFLHTRVVRLFQLKQHNSHVIYILCYP